MSSKSQQTIQVIEQTVVAKNPTKKSEDGIVVTDDFIAVIDGSTSKSDRRYSLFRSNGRFAMQIIAKFIRRSRADLTCHQFCLGASAAIAEHYRKSDIELLTAHPEHRLTASCIVFSRLRREIWMVGDCQCLLIPGPSTNPALSAVDSTPQYIDNPKPYEQELAEQRADIIRNSGQPLASFLVNDTARAAIIPHMLETMQQQNKTYAVVDGFRIPEQHVKVITLDFQHDNLTEDRTGWEIELLDENSETINLKDDSKLYSKWDKPVVESDGVKLEKGMTYYIRVSHGGSYTNETYHIRLR